MVNQFRFTGYTKIHSLFVGLCYAVRKSHHTGQIAMTQSKHVTQFMNAFFINKIRVTPKSKQADHTSLASKIRLALKLH